MFGKSFCRWTSTLLLTGIVLYSSGTWAAENESSLVGTTLTNFSLSSSQDRLISYGKDYYGRYYLIITFFPAAFTPV
jgi:hypothetical protein